MKKDLTDFVEGTMKNKVTGFFTFIREQGVMGLAIGIILGTAAKDVVNALISDIVSPFLGLFLGATETLKEAQFTINGRDFLWGHFISSVIDFVVIAAVVYFVFKGLKLDQIDKKKE